MLSIFDHREIELVLCGLPNIDKADWQKNTLYAGMYESKGNKHKVIKWFWKLVDELDDTMAARLLQFSTGTARVPIQGFKLLQGRDGDVRKFTITSVKMKDSVFPKAHTCFNRIELPLYTSYAECKRYVTDAVRFCFFLNENFFFFSSLSLSSTQLLTELFFFSFFFFFFFFFQINMELTGFGME